MTHRKAVAQPRNKAPASVAKVSRYAGNRGDDEDEDCRVTSKVVGREVRHVGEDRYSAPGALSTTRPPA